MAEGIVYDFGVQRNEDYLRAWSFAFDGEPLNITDWIFSLRINGAAGLVGDPLLTVGGSATENGSAITISDAEGGLANILIKQEDVAALPGRTIDVVKFAYNLLVTDSSGIRRADVRGAFIVEPGV